MTSRMPSLKGDKVAIDVEAGSSPPPAREDVAARFEVRDLLGEGGMGSVFAAQDRGLGRIVALKRLREGLEKDTGALRRFVLEAQIGAQLEHPNIVPLYSFERGATGSPAIAMQLLEGMTMDDYIQAAAKAPAEARSFRGEYSLKERVGTLLGVGEAIHFAHERGVIHRDLKPHNVMLGRYREVYVMDWGLARVVGSPIDMAREQRQSMVPEPAAAAPSDVDKETLGTLPTVASFEGAEENPSSSGSMGTRQGEVMGTAQYMPPEQALGLIDQLGPASDQYSLGVILQELATLKPARSHTNAMMALTQALQNHLAEPIDLDGRALHPALLAIIERATKRAPEDRYPTVRDMTEDLRRFIRDEPVSVYREGISRRVVRAASRRPGVAFGVLSFCGFLASAGIVGVVVHDARKTELQAREIENVRRVIVAVSSRAHDVDVELSELAADVRAVGAATIELLDRDAREFDRRPRPLPPLLPFEPSGGAPVSFAAGVVTWPGKAPDAELTPNAARLVRAERWLRACVVDALPKDDRKGTDEDRNEALLAGKSMLLRSFVGLEDGSFTQYPAREVTADPRKRPWYLMASRDPSLHWTRPVIDASRRTVRISAVQGLHSNGVFVGVAGCDLRVSSLAQKLRLDLPGFRQAYLVTEDGKIAVSEKLEKAMLATSAHPDSSLELPPVDDPELARRITGPDRGGYVESGDRLLVFSKLISLPWTYVAELDKGQYLIER
ncbi:MAG TPA: protein kinase [Polyangiaceae bacterium]